MDIYRRRGAPLHPDTTLPGYHLSRCPCKQHGNNIHDARYYGKYPRGRRRVSVKWNGYTFGQIHGFCFIKVYTMYFVVVRPISYICSDKSIYQGGQEFFRGGRRVQVRGNFHILASHCFSLYSNIQRIKNNYTVSPLSSFRGYDVCRI